MDGRLTGKVVSFGILILRQALQLVVVKPLLADCESR